MFERPSVTQMILGKFLGCLACGFKLATWLKLTFSVKTLAKKKRMKTLTSLLSFANIFPFLLSSNQMLNLLFSFSANSLFKNLYSLFMFCIFPLYLMVIYSYFDRFVYLEDKGAGDEERDNFFLSFWAVKCQWFSQPSFLHHFQAVN